MNLHRQFFTENACYQAGGAIVPKGVMVHSTGANNPSLRRFVAPNDGLLGEPSLRHWNQSGIDVCAHAFIGRLADDSVAAYQVLPWTMRGWHCGRGQRGSGNDTHISFEICEDGLEDPGYFQAVYREAVELTAYLCREYRLDPLGDGVVLCHAEGHQQGIASNHGDVLHWFPKFGRSMDDFRADVAREMEEDPLDEQKIRAMIREELAAAEAARAKLPASDWAVSYIQAAVKDGLMTANGSGGIDRPQAVPTRQELAVVAEAIYQKSKD